MKFVKSALATLLIAGFFSSCVPHPSKRPMPPGHDKKVEKLKENHPRNRNR